MISSTPSNHDDVLRSWPVRGGTLSAAPDVPYPDEHWDWAGINAKPEIHPTAWVAPGAIVYGRVRLKARSSIWFGCVLRGNQEWIEVGEEINVPDGLTLLFQPRVSRWHFRSASRLDRASDLRTRTRRLGVPLSGQCPKYGLNLNRMSIYQPAHRVSQIADQVESVRHLHGLRCACRRFLEVGITAVPADQEMMQPGQEQPR